MDKKQLSLLISLFFYLIVGLAAAVFLFLMGTGKINSAPQTTNSPAVIERSEKEAIAEARKQEEERELAASFHYYRFVTSNRFSSLNVRLAPNLTAKIIGKLSPGSKGYILEKGEDWSKIKTDTLEGYAYNDYLELEEISKEEHPFY